jgi:hypothetical protein
MLLKWKAFVVKKGNCYCFLKIDGAHLKICIFISSLIFFLQGKVWDESRVVPGISP